MTGVDFRLRPGRRGWAQEASKVDAQDRAAEVLRMARGVGRCAWVEGRGGDLPAARGGGLERPGRRCRSGAGSAGESREVGRSGGCCRGRGLQGFWLPQAAAAGLLAGR